MPYYRCVHTIHEEEFGNPEGTSLLRTPYKHWYFKDQLYRFDLIGHERGSVGTPIGKYPQGTPEAEQLELEETLRKMAVAENSYVIIPDTYTLENFAVNTQTKDLMLSVHHHDSEIGKSILAQWINMGQEGQGAGATGGGVSDDQGDFFKVALEARASDLGSLITRTVARQIVQYNMPGLAPDLYPRVKGVVSRLSAFGFADAVRKLLGKSQPALLWTDQDEQQLRERFQLPPMDETGAPRPVIPEGAGANDAGDTPNNPASPEAQDTKLGRYGVHYANAYTRITALSERIAGNGKIHAGVS